jgi:hypothetical protein
MAGHGDRYSTGLGDLADLANIYLHYGAPGQTGCFQWVKFPPRQEVQPPHRESSLGSEEATNWTKRRQATRDQ